MKLYLLILTLPLCLNRFVVNPPATVFGNIALIDSTAYMTVIEETFTIEERNTPGKPMVSVKCYVDSSGNVWKSQIYQIYDFELGEDKKELMLANVNKFLKFYVPAEYRNLSRDLVYVTITFRLKDYLTFSNSLIRADIKYVEPSISTIIRVNCDAFEKSFPESMDSVVVSDYLNLVKLSKRLRELKKTAAQSPDVRIKVEFIYYNGKKSILCMSGPEGQMQLDGQSIAYDPPLDDLVLDLINKK